jgi:meso-butanediol dehydrogenase/(S,S)-butanediol dehydrogenase/diacetyl reductase
MNFEGKVAIVTGGGSGIGREVVLKLAGLGAKVAVVDIEEESAEKVALEVREGGGEVLVVKADISDYDQVLGMAKGVY